MDASAVRELVERNRPKGHDASYPEEVRERVGQLAREARARGLTWQAIAELVGVSSTTARAWSRRGSVPGFLPVVVDNEPVQVQTRPAGARLVVSAPNGFAIEGLDLEQAIAALRALA